VSKTLLSARSAAVAVATLAASLGAQSTLALDGQTSVLRPIGSTVPVTVTALPGSPVLLMLDSTPGPTNVLGLSIPLGFGPGFASTILGAVPPSGPLAFDLKIPHHEALHAVQLYFAALSFDAAGPSGLAVSNGADLKIVVRPQLAGNPLTQMPFFQHVAAINRQAPVHLAVDPRLGYVQGKTARLYVVAEKTTAQWIASPALVDVRAGGAQTVTFPASATTIQQNTFQLDTGALLGPNESNNSNDTRLGVGYDVVIDFGQDGQFDDGIDLIDGYDDSEAGFYVCRDLARGSTATAASQGPLAVSTVLYTGGSFLGQKTYYPTAIASMGTLPVVVVSHGNGHNYQWYDHFGYHLASYGMIVMSHECNTMPGSHTAALSTIANTNYFFGNLATIAGGALAGKADPNRIVWIGHSRGGDGVARAYDLLFRGVSNPTNFAMSGIKLVSSMAPVDFGGWDGATGASGAAGNGSHPHDANFHLWVAQADSDVHGCASEPLVYWYSIYERSTRKRQSISLYGVGHGDLHASFSSSPWASGPSLIGRAETHKIMLGYLLALVKHHVDGDVPSRDYLWRQYESFRSVGASTVNGVVVNMTMRDDAQAGRYVIDDFQNQSTASPGVATSGATVSVGVQGFVEGRSDDVNGDFGHNLNDPFNGFTFDDAGNGGVSRSGAYASVLGFDGSANFSLAYDLSTAFSRPNLRDYGFLSFRAAQASRHPLTTAVLGDLTFSVSLEDNLGNQGTINIGAYGGGIEEPYQRNTDPPCGTGLGWNSEYETIRIRLTDFCNNGSNVDLSNVRKVVFRFGAGFGSTQGRIGLDEIELTRN
jgi:hypothetical protein